MDNSSLKFEIMAKQLYVASISFKEDEVELLVDRLGKIYSLNNAALTKALKENIIAGAGLDVIDKEPIAADNPLLEIQDSSKLIITPHIAWATYEARVRLMDEVYENIKAFEAGESRNVVV